MIKCHKKLPSDSHIERGQVFRLLGCAFSVGLYRSQTMQVGRVTPCAPFVDMVEQVVEVAGRNSQKPVSTFNHNEMISDCCPAKLRLESLKAHRQIGRARSILD